MEEACLNKGEKFSKVEQKLELLAQSKLQNLNQNTLKKVQDRLVSLEKGVTEQIASNQKIVRQYRLLLRKYDQQWQDMESRCNQTSHDRCKKISELKELMAQYFQREDSESKEIYKQAPSSFEEKIERTVKQLAEQTHQRKEQVRQLDDRVSQVVFTSRENIRRQFQAMDKKVDTKFEELTSNCDHLRQSINENTELRRKTETSIMQSLKQTVGQIKQILITQRSDRQKNKDKLCSLLNNAKQTIVVR